MLEHCDFVEKPTAIDEGGSRQSPDLVVYLPGETSIVIDSKVPIDAYLAATNAKTDVERADLMVAHTRQVKDHIRTLGAKEYHFALAVRVGKPTTSTAPPGRRARGSRLRSW
jgi:DNA recombination protein RmuC